MAAKTETHFLKGHKYRPQAPTLPVSLLEWPRQDDFVQPFFLIPNRAVYQFRLASQIATPHYFYLIDTPDINCEDNMLDKHNQR